MKWLYTHIFRGIGFVLFAACVTIVAIAVMSSSSCGRTDRAEDARQKEATKRVLDRMHANADEEIRKFNRSQMEKPTPPHPVEEGQ